MRARKASDELSPGVGNQRWQAAKIPDEWRFLAKKMVKSLISMFRFSFFKAVWISQDLETDETGTWQDLGLMKLAGQTDPEKTQQTQ